VNLPKAEKATDPIPAKNSSKEWLQCVTCGLHLAVAPLFFGCPQCLANGTVSEIEMRYARPFKLPASRADGIWGWQSRLPAIPEDSRISLGEGSTHVLPVPQSDEGPAVYLKNETTNPTWSWKDRPNAISVSMAKQFGYKKVIAISTGNHGNAMSAMAAAGGLEATVLCNAEAPPLQLALMEAYGARVLRGGNAEAMVLGAIKRGNYFPCTIFSLREAYSNPFGIEGFKTIAFEIWQQLGRVPHRVFVGVGSGDGIYGIWKGFRELREAGLVKTVPRIIGCQTTGANSLVRAFRKGAGTITRLSSLHTVASSLAELATGQQAVRAVYDSEGEAIEVSDKEALAAMHWMAKRGVALEPSSAVPLACLRRSRAVEGNKKNAGEIWVSIGSGAAPKWPDDVLRGFALPRLLPDSQESLPK
jgi:threonine synthase